MSERGISGAALVEALLAAIVAEVAAARDLDRPELIRQLFG